MPLQNVSCNVKIDCTPDLAAYVEDELTRLGCTPTVETMRDQTELVIEAVVSCKDALEAVKSFCLQILPPAMRNLGLLTKDELPHYTEINTYPLDSMEILDDLVEVDDLDD